MKPYILIFVDTLFIIVLLLWCKYVLFPSKKTYKYQDEAAIVLIALLCSGVGYYLDKNSTSVSPSSKPYLSADQQFEMGKAFYLGQDLPKDNGQALFWLSLAAHQDHEEAKELIRLFGAEQRPGEEGGGGGDGFAVDIIPAGKIKTKLDDIAGMSEAKKELGHLLEFIKNAKKFEVIGATPPKGIMLYGLPGTGKTLLARAIAGEADMTLISVSGAAFEEAFVGRGAARVRELFEIARRHKPAIIFIDEIDALAPSRSTRELSQSHIQTVNQLLSEIQNIDQEKNEGIFLLAATNRLESIDSALLRPGRFDWQVHIRLPSEEDRKAILTKLMEKVVMAKNMDLENMVLKSAGFSGAQLASLINEAAIHAVEKNRKVVENEDIEAAFIKMSSSEKALSPEFSLKIISPSEIKTKLSDIAGMNEAKSEVTEVIDFLKEPEKFSRLGAKPPTGILIYGPPGTGKTMMARAIAGSANASFITVSGSDFDEEYVGVGASRVRELFRVARKYKPCVVFIDEIDALAPTRSGHNNSGNDQTINQFLSEMDSVQSEANKGIIFIAATNRLDMIDPAVLRPGRFDRKVYFRLPALQEREEILKTHIAKIQSKDIDVKVLAKITVGYSGADLANLVNEAAIEATRNNKPYVDMASFEEANDKISLGVNQGIGTYTQKEKERTAYHEAGHALVGILLPDHPRTLHKLTIGLRGSSMGVTHFRLESDEYSYTKKEFEAMIATSLGGYIAEEIIYGKENVSAGASSDLVNANKIAKEMVTKLGMADDQSLIVTDVFPEDNPLKSAEEILKRDYDMAKKLLEDNKDKLHLIAKTLLEKEALDYDEMVKLLNLKVDKH